MKISLLIFDRMTALDAVGPLEIIGRAPGAGVSAGIHIALTLLSEVAGPKHAQFVQLMTEYDPQQPYCSGSLESASAAVR
ncbi:MAG: hypothetical protein VW709_11420 [Rickettsiales bacterium]